MSEHIFKTRTQAWEFMRSLTASKTELDVTPAERDLLKAVSIDYMTAYRKQTGAKIIPINVSMRPGRVNEHGYATPPSGAMIEFHQDHQWIEFELPQGKRSPIHDALDRLIETREPQFLKGDANDISTYRVLASKRRCGIAVREEKENAGAWLLFKDDSKRPLTKVVVEAINRSLAENLEVIVNCTPSQKKQIRNICSEKAAEFDLRVKCSATPIGMSITVRKCDAVAEMMEKLKDLAYFNKIDLVDLANAIGAHFGYDCLIPKQSPIPDNELAKERTGNIMDDHIMDATRQGILIDEEFWRHNEEREWESQLWPPAPAPYDDDDII